jgi:hypothetical protein
VRGNARAQRLLRRRHRERAQREHRLTKFETPGRPHR